MDFTGGSDGNVSAYNVGDPGSILGWEDAREKEMATPLPGKFQGRRSPVGYSSWGRKESDVTERLHSTLRDSVPLHLQKRETEAQNDPIMSPKP